MGNGRGKGFDRCKPFDADGGWCCGIRGTEFFELLLNVMYVREAEIVTLGGNVWMLILEKR